MYSAELADRVREFCDQEGLKYRFDEDMGVFEFTMSIPSKLRTCRVLVDVKDDGIICYAYSPLGVDAGPSRLAVGEYITRANYGIINGNFEMDFRDGEVRYKTYLRCDDCMPSLEDVKTCIFINITTFLRYANGLFSVIAGCATPEEAVAEAEDSDSLIGKLVSEAAREAIREAGEEGQE
jgi:hypothetical protein